MAVKCIRGNSNQNQAITEIHDRRAKQTVAEMTRTGKDKKRIWEQLKGLIRLPRAN